MTTLQIALITGVGGLWLGWISASLFHLYRKGGIRDLWKLNDSALDLLESEVKQGVKLLTENEALRALNKELLKRYILAGRPSSKDRPLPTAVNGTSLSEGTQGGERGSGLVDAPSSFAWVCERRGSHKFIHEVTPRRCVQCGLPEVDA